MASIEQTVDRYFATWNETDAARRRALIEQTWVADASYVDPVMSGDGQAGIDALIAGIQQRFPGHEMRLAGKIDTHHDRVRFGWELAPAGSSAPLIAGIDVGTLAADGRLRAIAGFIDLMPG